MNEIISNLEMSASISSISLALSEAQKKIEGAIRDAKNPYFNSDYTTLSSVWNACHIELNEQGIAIVQMPEIKDGKQIMVTLLAHKSGEWFRGECLVNPVKQDPQSMGSAFTYARRQSLAAMAGVAPRDDDGNEASKFEVIPKEKEKENIKQKVKSKETGLPEVIPEFIESIPSSLLLVNKPIQYLNGINFKDMKNEDLELVVETLKKSYESRLKIGKTSEHALKWWRAIITNASSMMGISP